MGSDNLFHRRRARRIKDLQRKRAKRAPYDRVLIVCEGSKTEPKYLGDLVDDLKLNSANIEVDGDGCGSSPISIVRHARARCHQERGKNDAFDRVYCVYDQDSHGSFQEANELVAALRPTKFFYAITSVPCFEFWLLLHYRCTTNPYNQAGNRSPCDQVISDLRVQLPGYAKGADDLFGELKPLLSTAIENSKRVMVASAQGNFRNPSTSMHELVEYLIELSS